MASGGPPDLTSGITRATQDGDVVPNSPLGNNYPLSFDTMHMVYAIVLV